MKDIAGLFAGPIETNEPQRAAARVGVNPIGEDTLVRRSELPRPGQHTAAVDPNRKVEGGPIFQRQGFGSQLGAAIERNGSARGKVHADAAARNACGKMADSSRQNASPSDRSGSDASAWME